MHYYKILIQLACVKEMTKQNRSANSKRTRQVGLRDRYFFQVNVTLWKGLHRSWKLAFQITLHLVCSL